MAMAAEPVGRRKAASKRGVVSSVLLICAWLPVLSQSAFSQDAFAEGWEAAVRKNPPDVQLKITLPEGKKVWWRGGIIPLQLEITSTSPDSWLAETRMYDRVGRMNYIEEFHLDPVDDVADPLRGLPAAGGGMGGLSGGPAALSLDPFVYKRELNEWVRFLRPGTYRLYVTTHRVCRAVDAGRSRWPMCAEAGQVTEITSNLVSFEIAEAPAGWAAEQLERALNILDAADGTIPDHEQQKRASRTIRS